MDERFLDYLADRDRQRSEAVERMLANMTERERALVKDAAVMAFVRGFQFCHANPGAGREQWPKDSAVLKDVLDSVRAFRDLYPNLSALDGES
jgi:hypothetical protein